MEETYKVYIQTDSSGGITAVNSSAFLSDTSGWTQIDEGSGDKYHHAQGNYFDKSAITGKGIYRYKLVDGAVVEKTDEEITAEENPTQTAEEIALATKKEEVLRLIDSSEYALPGELETQSETTGTILEEIIPAIMALI